VQRARPPASTAALDDVQVGQARRRAVGVCLAVARDEDFERGDAGRRLGAQLTDELAASGGDLTTEHPRQASGLFDDIERSAVSGASIGSSRF
jgi:hypothetical protein